MTTFAFALKDKNDANVTSLYNVVRVDFNWNGQIKTWAVVSTPTGATRGNPRFYDFGRKIEGMVLYGIMTTFTEVTDLRTALNGAYWQNRPARLYYTASAYHEGQVADFKAYFDRTQGGEDYIRYTLTFVIGGKLLDSF